MSATAPSVAGATSFKADATVMSLIGFAHATSHFFHLLLPPLFPWFMKDFGLGFAEVGTLMTVFFVISGIGQALAGFVVDRFGAHRVLCGGVALLSASGLLVAAASGFAALFAAAAVAGLGNSVFHPADFTLINRRVSVPRLGHAFSIHGLTGNLGWAISPIFMTSIAIAFGWRAAGLGAALVGALALAFLIWKRELLQYELRRSRIDEGTQNKPAVPMKDGKDGGTWSFLRVRVIWLAFAYFLLTTFAFGALQNFAPSLLRELYDLSIALATSALTAYLLGGSAGLVLGGFLVKGRQSFEYLIASSLLAGALLALLLAFAIMPAGLVLPLMVAMGFSVGIAGPSRDMLVRRAAAAQLGEGAFGRVYGFVYSGLDVGLALAPVAFGLLLDAHLPKLVFIAVGATFMLAIIAALAVGRDGRGGSEPRAAASR
ncbi:MAG TPA: MFS transporter [Usitatibacteraceae bacterium]